MTPFAKDVLIDSKKREPGSGIPDNTRLLFLSELREFTTIRRRFGEDPVVVRYSEPMKLEPYRVSNDENDYLSGYAF